MRQQRLVSLPSDLLLWIVDLLGPASVRGLAATCRALWLLAADRHISVRMDAEADLLDVYHVLPRLLRAGECLRTLTLSGVPREWLPRLTLLSVATQLQQLHLSVRDNEGSTGISVGFDDSHNILSTLYPWQAISSLPNLRDLRISGVLSVVETMDLVHLGWPRLEELVILPVASWFAADSEWNEPVRHDSGGTCPHLQSVRLSFVPTTRVCAWIASAVPHLQSLGLQPPMLETGQQTLTSLGELAAAGRLGDLRRLRLELRDGTVPCTLASTLASKIGRLEQLTLVGEVVALQALLTGWWSGGGGSATTCDELCLHVVSPITTSSEEQPLLQAPPEGSCQRMRVFLPMGVMLETERWAGLVTSLSQGVDLIITPNESHYSPLFSFWMNPHAITPRDRAVLHQWWVHCAQAFAAGSGARMQHFSLGFSRCAFAFRTFDLLEWIRRWQQRSGPRRVVLNLRGSHLDDEGLAALMVSLPDSVRELVVDARQTDIQCTSALPKPRAGLERMHVWLDVDHETVPPLGWTRCGRCYWRPVVDSTEAAAPPPTKLIEIGPPLPHATTSSS